MKEKMKLGRESQSQVGENLLSPSIFEESEVKHDDQTMKIGPYKITELSSLADLRLACKFMRVSPHGPKKLLWQRLQQEVMKSKLSIAVAVEVSDDIKKDFFEIQFQKLYFS